MLVQREILAYLVVQEHYAQSQSPQSDCVAFLVVASRTSTQ